MTELDELRRQLAAAPTNLGVRVALGKALLAEGKTAEGIEMYRSAAIACRDQGLTQQATALCRAVLELAPHDPMSRGMLAALGEPERVSGYAPTDQTPLPDPLPYHVADPTRQIRRSSEPEITSEPAAATQPAMPAWPAGQGPAAERDSADLTSAAATQPSMRMIERDSAELTPATSPLALVDLDDVVTPYVREDVDGRDTDRELPDVTNPNIQVTTTAQRLIAGALFSTIPPEHRAGVYARFATRAVRSGVTVIRQGEVDHPLFVVGRGELAVRVQRGHEVVMLYEVHEGEPVGEGSLLARKASPAHVVAITDCELVLLPPKEVYEVAGAFPALWARLKDIAEKRARTHRALLG